MFISTPYITWMHVKYENKVTCKCWSLHVGEESSLLHVSMVTNRSSRKLWCRKLHYVEKHFRDYFNTFTNKELVLQSFCYWLFLYYWSSYDSFILTFMISCLKWNAMIWVRGEETPFQIKMIIELCVIVDAKRTIVAITQIFWPLIYLRENVRLLTHNIHYPELVCDNAFSASTISFFI